jgi:hydrophobe/amphiphile efflux-1 (HAE1) family protein
MISVSAKLPGADPETVAQSLAAPLERRLGQIPGVNEMTSSSSLGGCSINLQFDLSRNIDSAARDVMAAINASSSDLPVNIPGPPQYRKSNPADMPILVLAMTSDTIQSTKVFQFADEIIGQRLCQVEGVSQVDINGAEKSAVRIQINPAALAMKGLSMEDLRSFLGQVNVNLAKGSFDGGSTSYTIAVNDQLRSYTDYKGLIVTQKGGVPVLLESLGKVVDGVENNRRAGWSGSKPAVLLLVFKQPDANVVATVDRIKDALPQVQRWIPPGVKLTVISDRTKTIRASIQEVQIALGFSVLLVVLVMLLFLRRFWPTFIATVTVPLSLAGTFGAMYLLGYSLDNLSLMALAISVGFVVDDAIVVIENIHRFVEEGDSPFDAAMKGARQIGFTIVSISLSLVAVFIPLLFMGGLIGRLFHEFSVTLTVSILVSAVVSLTLTPMLCSRYLKPESAYPKKQNVVFRASEATFDWLLEVYKRSLRWVLLHQTFMSGISLLILGITVWLYVVVPKGFFPQQDTGVIMGTTEGALDISFAAMSKLQRKAADIVLSDPAVDTVASFVGSSSSSPNNGRMYITLKPLEERKVKADEIITRLRKKLAPLQGISLYLQASQDLRMGGRSSKAQYQYALQSSDIGQLKEWAPKLADKLRKIPQLRDVTSDQQNGGLQSTVVVDRDAASRLSISPLAVDEALYNAFGQRQVSTIYERYNQHHVILEVDPAYQQDPSALNKIFVKSSSGQQIPLAAVARFQTTNTPLSIGHQGQFPCVTVSYGLAPGVSLGEASDLVLKATADMGLPSSIKGSFQGTAQAFQGSLNSMPLLIGAALIAVYIVLGMLYENLIHPVTILSTLPSAGVGALLALMICRSELSLVSFIGLILLMGIVKKNAIMMVDFALESERRLHRGPEEAIYEACVVRFRPIMMTTLAAMFGAVPLAIGFGTGSELRQPLGIAVVGGLLVSQVVTLYTTPVIYVRFEHLKQWVRGLFRLKSSLRKPVIHGA